MSIVELGVIDWSAQYRSAQGCDPSVGRAAAEAIIVTNFAVSRVNVDHWDPALFYAAGPPRELAQ
jgi:hypothetical protein